MAYTAYKYRLYPTEEQCTQMARTFGCCRKVYNETLARNNAIRAAGGKRPSKTDANNYCNAVFKDRFPFLRDVDKFALTNAIYALYNGYDKFFRHECRFPRFNKP